MNYYEIIKKLIGPIESTGQHEVDMFVRKKNLEAMIELTDRLIGDISVASEDANREEASVSAIGRTAKEFMDDLKGTF